MATARFTIYVAAARGRPGHPLTAETVLDPGLRFGWRMLAANNREVARSSITFPDVAGCLEAIHVLRAQLFTGVLVAARNGRSDWTWRLRVDGTDVATSSRTYQRRLQCEAAGALFMDLVTDAEIAVPFDHGGFDSGAATSVA